MLSCKCLICSRPVTPLTHSTQFTVYLESTCLYLTKDLLKISICIVLVQIGPQLLELPADQHPQAADSFVLTPLVFM